jgi:hypothetical protein
MSTTTRRVRAVRLRAPSDALARRGATVLEDALHTASIPGADGARLLVIRSLDVGTIDPGRGPAAVALAVESRLHRLRDHAVHADDPAAATAAAVFFHDRVDALAALAATVAVGRSPDAWFWRAALPWVTPGAPREETLRAALVHAFADGPAAGAALVAALHARDGAGAGGIVDSALAALRREDGPPLLRLCGWPAANASPERSPPPSPTLDGVPLSLLGRWAQRWGGDDTRTAWLAATLLIARRPTRLLDPRLPVHARALVAHAIESRLPLPTEAPAGADGAGGATTPPAPRTDSRDRGHDRRTSQPRPNILAGPADAGERAAPAFDGGVSGDAAAAVTLHGAPPTPHHEAPVTRPAPHLPDPPAEACRIVAADESLATEGAGLFFLTSVLERLGIRGFLEARPAMIEADLPDHVLRRIAASAGVPPEDPVVACLAASGWAQRPIPVTDVEIAAAGWHTAARRWCRRYAGIGLRELVLRPGRIRFTRTHLDVVLDHRTADIRVRRAGLDLDPGWVLWLGRVVTFHYHVGGVSGG